jgi:hypothetical protein
MVNNCVNPLSCYLLLCRVISDPPEARTKGTDMEFALPPIGVCLFLAITTAANRDWRGAFVFVGLAIILSTVSMVAGR